MSADTIETSVGTVPVLHRLAQGLVIQDAVTDRGVTGWLRVGWEAEGHLLPPDASDLWPCVDFEPVGVARFRLRATVKLPKKLTVRIDDPSRRHVPRRVEITPWAYEELRAAETAAAVAVASRALKIWLHPGAAYPLPPGTTAIRGRVLRQGLPVPWARVEATGNTGATLGRAHGDDRGEFLLRLTDVAQNPVQSTVVVDLSVRGPVNASALPPVEPIARPGNPPAPGDLDNAVLRGLAPPAGYVLSTPPPPGLPVPVGRVLVVDDIPFIP
jgi:hypothetical protein